MNAHSNLFVLICLSLAAATLTFPRTGIAQGKSNGQGNPPAGPNAGPLNAPEGIVFSADDQDTFSAALAPLDDGGLAIEVPSLLSLIANRWSLVLESDHPTEGLKLFSSLDAQALDSWYFSLNESALQLDGIDLSLSGGGFLIDGASVLTEASERLSLGHGVLVTGFGSAGFGQQISVSGNSSLAFGNNSAVDGDGSLAGGSGSSADGDNSFAMGIDVHATGTASLSVGEGTIANLSGQAVIGTWNLLPDTLPTSVSDEWLFVIGNGTSSEAGPARSNALTVERDGDTSLSGNLLVEGEGLINGDVEIRGEATIARVPPRGGISMGIFTDEPPGGETD